MKVRPAIHYPVHLTGTPEQSRRTGIPDTGGAHTLFRHTCQVCQFNMDFREDELHLLALLALAYVNNKQRRKKRKQWCKQWMERRNKFTHINLLNELRDEPSDFSNYLRMNESVYNELLSLISPLIKKKDTQMRVAISPHERLTATLRYLATGQPYESLKYSTRISPQALGRIIPETCEALYKVLQKYIKVCLVFFSSYF